MLSDKPSFTDEHLRQLVRPDRVHRSLYTDPAIFELEMNRIFRRSWIFVGHESQIPKPGDYFTSRIAKDSFIFVRHDDGSIRGILNRCTHKGMQIIPEDGRGHAKLFRCAYHGWTFRLDGAVRTIPAVTGYEHSCVSTSNGASDLLKVPALDLYRGFIFARLTDKGPTLLDWMGPMRSSIDNFVDRAPEGRVEAAGGVLHYLHDCNWKFFVENTLDTMHPMVAHQSAITAANQVKAECNSREEATPEVLDMILPFGAPYSFYNDMGQRGTAYGHGDLGNFSDSMSANMGVGDYLERLQTAYGDKKALEILRINRINSVLYPSVMFKANVSLLRIVKPISVDKTILETWHFRLCGAPDEIFRRTIQYSTIVNSSAGPVGPDDHEAYRRLQSGLDAPASDWVMMARYLNQEKPDHEGAMAALGTSDFVHRNQFSAWLEYMQAG